MDSPADSHPLISVIISTRDKPWPGLSKTLESVLSADFHSHEVILVDQNTHDGINKEIATDNKYREIIYLRSSAKGLSRGRNQGIAHARGRWYIFLDDDAIIPPDAFKRAASILDKERDKPVIFYGSVVTLETGRPYLKKAAAMGKRISPLNFDSVCSIALIFNRSIFDQAGLFDEKLGAGADFGAGEESDMILRALDKGYEISYIDDYRICHPEAIGNTDLEKRRSYGMGAGAVYRKHLLDSSYIFLVLSMRLLGELLLRTALIAGSFGSAHMRKYHSCYLSGFIRGFVKYGNSDHSNIRS